MKITAAAILIILAGCGEAGTMDIDTQYYGNYSEDEGMKVKEIRGYAGITPVFEGRVEAREWGSSEILSSAVTDNNGIFNMYIPSNDDAQLITLTMQDGYYVEASDGSTKVIGVDGLSTVITIDEIRYPVYITPFTDMVYSLHLNFAQNNNIAGDPLEYARYVLADYFEIDFTRTSPAANIGVYSSEDDDPWCYQFIIDALSQMASDLDIKSSFVLTRGFSASLEAGGNFSGYSDGGGRILIDNYNINYNSIRVDFTTALEKLMKKRKIKSKVLEDYLDRLRTKSSTLFGPVTYAK